MNTDSALSALRQLLTLVFTALTIFAPKIATAQQLSDLSAAIITAVPALLTIGNLVWSLWEHWNMRKVPEKAVAVILPPTDEPPPAKGTTIDLGPLTGTAKVV